MKRSQKNKEELVFEKNFYFVETNKREERWSFSWYERHMQ
jgi:hypothetical protein